MTTPGISPSQFEFKYIGNPTSNAARIKAMAGDGPLLVAKDHALPLMMPKAFDDTAHAPSVKIDSTDLMALLGPHLLYDAEVAAGGMHFITKAAFWAALLKSMLETGNAWPAFGGTRAEAMPSAACVLAKIIGDVPMVGQPVWWARPHPACFCLGGGAPRGSYARLGLLARAPCSH
jgi:hypothetical protein